MKLFVRNCKRLHFFLSPPSYPFLLIPLLFNIHQKEMRTRGEKGRIDAGGDKLWSFWITSNIGEKRDIKRSR